MGELNIQYPILNIECPTKHGISKPYCPPILPVGYWIWILDIGYSIFVCHSLPTFSFNSDKNPRTSFQLSSPPETGSMNKNR